MRIKTALIAVLGLALLGAGATFLVVKFKKDRENTMRFSSAMNHTMVNQEGTTTVSDGKTTKTYTAAELEEARKKGQLPKGIQPMGVAQTNANNDAAVQRNLRTLEEINKINAMNQRLMEEQQRMQRQNK